MVSSANTDSGGGSASASLPTSRVGGRGNVDGADNSSTGPGDVIVGTTPTDGGSPAPDTMQTNTDPIGIPQGGGITSGIKALDVSNVHSYDKVIVRGAKFSADIADKVTTMSLDMDKDSTTQLTVTMEDPDFHILGGNLFGLKASVDYINQHLEVSAFSIEPGQAGSGEFVVECRSATVNKLKYDRVGPLVMRNVSRSDFVKAECQVVGAKYFIQDSPTVATVSRDVALPGVVPQEQQQIPSSWTTFQALAEEIGFWCFEAAGTVFFAKPSYMLANRPHFPIRWIPGSSTEEPKPIPFGGKKYPGMLPLELPNCRRTEDNFLHVEVNMKLPWGYSNMLLPGNIVEFSGVPHFTGKYIISKVTLPIGQAAPIEVTMVNPRDPIGSQEFQNPGVTAITQAAGGTGPGSGYPTGGLTIDKFIVGLRAQESGGNYTATNPSGASGAYQYIDSTWGNYGGYARAYLAPTSVQDQKARADVNALYGKYGDWAIVAACWLCGDNSQASDPSKWNQPPLDGNGHPTNNPTVHDYVMGVLQKAGGQAQSIPTASELPTGTKQASDFVGFALAQAGKQYVLGGVPNIDSVSDPTTFDCSELVQWCAYKTGIIINAPAETQYENCLAAGTTISVADAINTRGALLFYRPGATVEHVAISLGDGRTIEARGRAYGVNIFSATQGRAFSLAGLVPGMQYGRSNVSRANQG